MTVKGQLLKALTNGISENIMAKGICKILQPFTVFIKSNKK